MSTRYLLAALAAFCAMFGATAAASAANMPSCDQPQLIQSLTSRFERHSREFLGQNLAIARFQRIRETSHMPSYRRAQVERRFCNSKIVTTDGRKRDLYYLIESDFGFVGLSSAVEFCSTGLDPWFVYGAYCKSLRAP